jgi:UDP-N-acetylglucosamine:LPS N-acetylglucosamine transferase
MIAISPTFKATARAKKVLAVASGGGHWVELLRLMPAFEGADVAYVTVNEEYRQDVEGHRFYVVNDATRWNKAAMALMAARLGGILLRERPDVVVTTGAAPGFFAIRLAKMVGAKTVWLDSIANVDELSMSGQLAGKFADLWLTQWPHLANSKSTRQSHTIRSREPLFAGAVL